MGETRQGISLFWNLLAHISMLACMVYGLVMLEMVPLFIHFKLFIQVGMQWHIELRYSKLSKSLSNPAFKSALFCLLFVPVLYQPWLHPRPCRALPHSSCSRLPLILGPEQGNGDSLPAEIGPLGLLFFVGPYCLPAGFSLTCIFSKLIVVIICKERFPLTVHFWAESRKMNGFC